MYVVAYAPFGADGILIRVEADIRRGIPGVDVTGLADAAVREARERVRVACRNSGFRFPADRILVNLAPAGVRKEGAGLDLPIALAILSAAGLTPSAAGLMVLGELELSGAVRGVRGVLAATAAGLAAGVEGFIVPAENAAEARILAGDRCAAVADLGQAAAALAERARSGRLPALSEPEACAAAPAAAGRVGDFADARGQARCKRALEIAAAGGHNLLAFGPPGAGKTLLARRFPGIQAPLTKAEAVETTRLHSLAGSGGGGLVDRPPFRSPHHSASAEGLLGGGRGVRPGEISLAHFGTLFLDEAPEFRANVLRALREPLEDAVVTIARAEGSVRLPADFQLLLAANPCPCGRLGLGGASCFCSGEETARYWRRLGAALLDRIELRVPLWPSPLDDAPESGERSAAVADRVAAAVERQRARYGPGGPRRNARLDAADVDRYCRLSASADRVYRLALAKLGLSSRAAHAVRRVARTIADLAGSAEIAADHVLEAVQHRRYGEDPFDIVAARAAAGEDGRGS